MKESIIAIILTLCLVVSVTGIGEEQSTVLFADGARAGELRLCRFEESPNVPYLGIGEYAEKILNIPLSMEEDGEGVVTLSNGQGGELRCDIAAGTVFTPDWIKVITPETPLEGAARSLKDSSCGFVRIKEITYEGDPAPVTFDFAKYGMKMYADEQDVYLPLSVLSNMMSDIATRHLRYDGERLYLSRMDMKGNADDPVLNSNAMTALLTGKERSDDVIRQCYAELCFNFDYFFGHPGRAALDAEIAAKGLDAALESLGEEGAEIKAGLLSPDMAAYLAAMQKLFTVWLYDGHTVATDISTLTNVRTVRSDPRLLSRLTANFMTDFMSSTNAMTMTLRMAITPQRRLAWGDAAYRETGNTAIIRLDSFLPDEAAWEAWYKGEGAFPEDSLGTVVTGLRKAQENPEIRNVLFDLTCNGGGSSDVLMAILGITTGRDYLLGRNVLTGQAMRVTFETDCNFDGVFDEKDREARFDFNYGVLTTRQAFSCGNLFPIVMRESGAVVLGETTGGGSCCIQIGTDTYGIRYVMSSAQWQLLNENGKDVEDGCSVDIPIGTGSIGLIDKLVSSLGVDEGIPLYSAYFEEENLGNLMNAWFHVIPLAPAA